jgi:hypothetical protein
MPSRVLISRWYAKMYHWTPEQVGELPVEEYDWLPALEIAEYEAQAAEQRAEAARNRPRGGGRHG